ncbi:transposase [Cucumis melo var. makuwa]|uniref:Transposase n=1 Tax=Cucumis melo var. makuwa TaxID=1194695 RepID=A0A5A7VAL2_CUCMM|nr:transposase [Cucumis melo var. makuwa]
MYEESDVGNIKEMVEIAHEQYSKDPSGFEKLLNDVEKPLYEDAKNSPSALGMEYEKIHACPNDCCLYRKEYANAIVCPECGPKQPGDDIGIYLEPLIDDLKLLWESGVQCYDIYNEELFNLRTVLLWTINDFPAYGNLSGCSVKGYKACPICTLLDIPGKTKDGLNVRRDLADLKIRPELTPINGEKKIFIPPACYTLTKKEKRFLLKSLSEMKVPRGYSSNVTNLMSIEDSKLIGLKSHDCHVLLQQLLPVAIRSVLPKHVRYAITRLCLFFNSICNKVIDVTQVEKLQEDIVITLCLLEKYFPPSFFTIMVHLTVHLVREVKLCGPIYLRWMYPFERFMKVIKNAVRNRNCLEGCIAEGYILEEAVEFCSEFLCGVDPIGLGCQKLRDNSDYSELGRPLSSGVTSIPERELLYQAHRYVLENTVDVQPYIELKQNLQQEMLRFQITCGELLMALIQFGGIKTDDLGFVLVDLSRVGHKNDSFIFATQAKQVFFVEDPSDSRWSIVLTPPQRDFADQYNDDELGDTVLNCQGMPKTTIDIESRLDLDENTPTYIHSYTMELPTDEDLTLRLDEVEIGLDNAHTDHLEQVDASKNKKKKTRGLTLMHDVTRIKSTREKTVVEYNENGIPIGENGHKLQSFIGSCVRHHIPITHASWKVVPTELKEKICSMVEGAFIVDGRSKKVIMKTAGVSFRQLKSWLTTQYIIPFMDELQLLIDPPSLYAHIIDKPVWQEFVRSRMSSEFQKLRREQQDRRKRSKYTHNMSRRGYANLAKNMVIKNVIVFYKYILKFNYGVLNDIQKKGSFEEQDFGRANMWKKARTKKDGGYINEDVQQVANEIDEILDKAPNEESPNDALTQALGTPEYGGRERGVGGFITPTVYFHQAKPRKSKKVDTTQQIIDENEALRKRIRELEQKVQSIPTSEHGSCSKSKIQEKVKSSRPMTKEVEVTSEPSNLPIQLKYILRYAERGLDDFPISEEFEKDQQNNILESGKGTVECGYYVMRYMHEILSKDTSIITDAIDTRNSYSQLELDEVRVEWAKFLSRYI